MKLTNMKKKSPILIICLLLIGCFASKANNLTVSNLSIVSTNTSSQTANIKLDLSWENSWRDNENWDAAWVFVKFRQVGGADTWGHCTLNQTGHIYPANSVLTASDDGKGAFIYRAANGSGMASFTDIELVWDYGTDGLASMELIELKAFGIEMVYVPAGSFFVGDGQTINNELYGNFEAGTTGLPFEITSENTITLGGGSTGSLGNNNHVNQFGHIGSCGGCLNGSGDDFDDVNTQTLPLEFPKGYDAFYCMKYEMTQQQFVDMLNTLDATQQTTYLTQTSTFYYNGTLASNRYDITISNGEYTTADPYAPMIFYDWIKSAAYADWCALRPMTELEFEKACRGHDIPVLNEYAWGTANIDISDNLTLNNVGAANEGIASGYDAGGVNGNAWMRVGGQTMNNVARVGIFSAHASNSGRITSGSSVWGIMELSGNAWERAVSVGHSEGRKFTGLHGDGILSINGYADVTNWPGTFAGTEVNSNIGVGYRGGALAYPTPNLERNGRVSSRRLASGYWNTVINDDGARFVRTID